MKEYIIGMITGASLIVAAFLFMGQTRNKWLTKKIFTILERNY